MQRRNKTTPIQDVSSYEPKICTPEEQTYFEFMREATVKVYISSFVSNVMDKTGIAFLLRTFGIQSTVYQTVSAWTGLAIDAKKLQTETESIFRTLKKESETFNFQDKESYLKFSRRLKNLSNHLEYFTRNWQHKDKMILMESYHKFLKKIQTTLAAKLNTDSNNNNNNKKKEKKITEQNDLYLSVIADFFILNHVCVEHFIKIKDYHAALEYLFKALSVIDELASIIPMAETRAEAQADLYTSLGFILVEFGNLEEAGDKLTSAIKFIKNRSKMPVRLDDALVNLIEAHIHSRNYLEALHWIENAASLCDPKQLQAFYNKALNAHRDAILTEIVNKHNASANYTLTLTDDHYLKIVIEDKSFKVNRKNYSKTTDGHCINILNNGVQEMKERIEEEINNLDVYLMQKKERQNKSEKQTKTVDNKTNNENNQVPETITQTTNENLKSEYRGYKEISKIKTKGIPGVNHNASNNNSNNSPKEHSIFGEEYDNADICPLTFPKNFIPKDTYFGLFRPPEKSMFGANKDKIYQKFIEILERGHIGNEIKFANHTFKLAPRGDVVGDARMWSHVEKEVVINGKHYFLIVFDDEQNHRTQKQKY